MDKIQEHDYVRVNRPGHKHHQKDGYALHYFKERDLWMVNLFDPLAPTALFGKEDLEVSPPEVVAHRERIRAFCALEETLRKMADTIKERCRVMTEMENPRSGESTSQGLVTELVHLGEDLCALEEYGPTPPQ